MTTSCLLLSLLAAAAGQQPHWQVGLGITDITPEPATGQWLAGLGDPEDHRVSVGAHDPIWCRALAVSDGETTVVLAVCDLIGLFHNDIDEIRAKVTGVPPERLLIGCTHVHSAPDTLGLWGPADDQSGVDPKFLQFVQDQAVKAIQQALDSLQPATLRLAEGRSPAECSRNYNDAEIKDDAVAILQAVGSDGKVIATLVNWACHPEVLWTDNKQITSDYVHYLRETVKAAQGGEVVFFNGDLGGMVSPDNHDRHTFDEAERIGTAVGDEVNRALTEAKDLPAARLRFAHQVFEIPTDNPPIVALLKLGVLKRTDPDPATAITTEVAALRLGPSLWITMPGEALPATGFLAKTLMDGEPKFLLGLTLDELGYILPAQAIGLKKYGYELSMGVNPRAAQYILEALSQVLTEIGREE